MPISASQIVEVNPRILNAAGNDLQFNALFLTGNASIPTSEFVLSFASADDVGAYFGTASEEYALASVYFRGYDDSFKKPDVLYFAPNTADSSFAAFVRGAKNAATLSVLQTITSGDFNWTIGGKNLSLTGINLSSATSLSGAALILQTAIRAYSNANVSSATVSYSNGKITITAGANGADTTFSYAIGSVAAALKLQQTDGGTLSAGTVSAAAYLEGDDVTATLAELQEITNGSLNMTINGYNVAASGIDFSGISAIGDVAAILQDAIRNSISFTDTQNATVSYSSDFNAYLVTSGANGDDETISYPTGSIASAMGLDAAAASTLSYGSDQLSPAETMQKVAEHTRNFVTFMTVSEVTAANAVAFATWAAAQGEADYLYVFWDDNEQNTSANPVGTIAQALTDANAGACAGIYGTAEYGAFLCSIAACVNYNRVNGAITFKFKGQSGLGANVANSTVALHVAANNMNFIGNYATINDSFVFLANGVMFGKWNWLDTYLNAVFLKDALQVACMNGLVNSPRVPFTEDGYALVRAWLQDPINRALNAGVMETGVNLSEGQRAELMREAGGIDIAQYLVTDGYYVLVQEASPSVRQARGPLAVSLWYAYGGAIHRLVIDSTAVV